MRISKIARTKPRGEKPVLGQPVASSVVSRVDDFSRVAEQSRQSQQAASSHRLTNRSFGEQIQRVEQVTRLEILGVKQQRQFRATQDDAIDVSIAKQLDRTLRCRQHLVV